MMKLFNLLVTFMVLFTLIIFAGCSDNDNPLAAFEPEIINNQDSFEFQATNIENVTATLSYSWINTGTMANIDHSTAKTSGTAVITIFDVNDSLVYSSDFLASGNHDSQVGESGAWTVVVILTDFNGTANFRVEKK